MSEKRRDKRNRILREGEYQRADGRYRFRYIDEDGKEKNVYSWRLDKNDPTPKGKKHELSLREKEKQIQADLFDHIVTNGGNLTVLELVEKYISLKTGVRHSTKAGYKTVTNILKKEHFGKLRIDKVHLSDAKAWKALSVLWVISSTSWAVPSAPWLWVFCCPWAVMLAPWIPSLTVPS